MYEINLVPDVKSEMIKAQKTRNLVLFICIAVTAVAVGVILILLGIKGGQDIAMTNQDKKLATMSEKLMGYDEIDEFLTIQDQLSKLSSISDNKKVLSRVFNILEVMLPKGADKISLSELTINLDDNQLTFEGQADAGVEPFIDYRVLESFKKSVALITYDYGSYVDAVGAQIPAYCVNEHDDNGARLNKNGSYYGIWYKDVKGCDPQNIDVGANSIAERNSDRDVIIWRTPQFDDWYKSGHMDLDGSISEVAHFEGVCRKYSGTQIGNSVKWATSNDCLLAPEGVKVSSSSNGRDASDNLVLRFSASIDLDPEVLAFKNKYMVTLGPSGQDVTDSYRQIQDMFAKRAEDCEANDTACEAAQTTEEKE